MQAQLRRPSLPLKVLSGTSRALLWLIVLAWLVFGAAWATLQWVIVPRIGELRPWLETRASQAVGLPVRIGAIAAHRGKLLPSFELQDIELIGPDGAPALTLPRVQATVSPRSLWHLGFEQLAIERPELDVLRSADGRIHVAGLEIPEHQGSDGRVADWVFSQTEWLITGGHVRWRDELLGAPPVELQQVDLRLYNNRLRHELRLDATPPAELSGRVSLSGRFRAPLLFARPGDWQRWKGQFYAALDQVDLTELRRHVPLPAQWQFQVSGGKGSLRAWADVDQGRVSGVTADLALAQLAVRLAPDLPALELDRLSGRLSGKMPTSGYELSTQGLQFDTRDGLKWRAGDVHLSQTEASRGAAVQGELRVNGIDLGLLAMLAQRLPLGERLHRDLQNYAPQGQLEQLQARWRGRWEAPESYEARGRLAGIEVAAQAQPLQAGGAAIAAKPASAMAGAATAANSATVAAAAAPHDHLMGSPGVHGLTVDFDLTQAGGRASVLVRQGYVELPGLFEQPRIALDQLAADMQWRKQGEQLSLQINDARFANADAQGEFQLRWQTGSGRNARLPGVLDLQGSFSRAQIAALYRYLPQEIPADVRDYLHHALTQGVTGGARFRVKGDLREFPFRQPSHGEFHITANVQDARFVYVPASLQPAGELPWPALTEVNGDLVIDRASLQLHNVNARVEGAPQLRVAQGEARIPDMGHNTRVQTSLQLSGPLDDMLKGVVQASPLDAMLDGLLAQTRATGLADLPLQLDLPLLDMHHSHVLGQLKLSGNDVQLRPDVPRLGRARGTVHFNEQGFALAGVQARLLGGEARADGGTISVPGASAQGAPRLRVQGTFTAPGLRQESQLGALAVLGRKMSGGASYTAEFGLRQGIPEYLLTSNLQGLALDLPAPLAKPAEVALPLHFQINRVNSAPGAAAQDLLRFDLGRLLALRYVREHGDDAVKVLQGSIGVGLAEGASVPLPDTGVVADVQFDTLDLDAWRQAVAVPGGSGSASTGSAGNGVPAALRDYLPTSVILKGNTLHAGEQTWRQLVAGGTREGQTWRINVDARELSGYLEYRMPGEVGSGSVYARLARLVLAQENARGAEYVLDEQPIAIPALDVAINQFELRGKQLGRVEIEAVNNGLSRRDAGAREWRLNRLHLLMPEAEFTATGNWATDEEAGEAASSSTTTPATGPRRTTMNFKLAVSDAGGLLSRLGMPGLVRAGHGLMEGQASWTGSPMGLDYPSMGGSFNINIERGQFLKADPGLAKLLGVLSLQSLPRRLTLDFRDVFSEGFAFDFVRGDVKIAQGLAQTNNLQMKGVSAAALMSGQTDLAHETQDLKVVVVPEINAGTASLVAAAINPAIGLTTFLAQYFLRRPAMEAATQELHITGTWSDPQVNRVEKTSSSTPPDTEAPVAAPTP